MGMEDSTSKTPVSLVLSTQLIVPNVGRVYKFSEFQELFDELAFHFTNDCAPVGAPPNFSDSQPSHNPLIAQVSPCCD